MLEDRHLNIQSSPRIAVSYWRDDQLLHSPQGWDPRSPSIALEVWKVLGELLILNPGWKLESLGSAIREGISSGSNSGQINSLT